MGRGLGWVLGLLAPARRAPSLCEQMHWNVRGEGARGRRRWTWVTVPPLPSPPAPGVARDWDSLCSPLAPGKVPGRPVPQSFLGSCQMLKGEGSPAGPGGEGVCMSMCECVCVSVSVCVAGEGPGLGAGPAGVTSYGRGARSRGPRPRRTARRGLSGLHDCSRGTCWAGH